MNGRAGILVMIGLLLVACGDDGDQEMEAEAPGMIQLQEEIFEPGCSHDACHAGEAGIAGLTFSDPELAYEQLVGVDPINGPARNDGLVRVAEGDVETSFLWTKMTLTPDELSAREYGAAMPMGTSTVPGPKSMEAIRQWIEAGAPLDGAEFEADFEETQDFENYVSCDAEDEEGLRDCFGEEPDPEAFLRLYSPKLVIPPNSDTTLCSYLDFHAPEDITLTATRGQQMDGGHHTAVFVANSPRTDFEPDECTDEEMMNYRYVAGAGGGGGLDTEMPDGVALRIQEGQQVVIQSHYINTSDEPMTVMDAVDLEYAEDEADAIADPFAMIDDDFEVPPQTEGYERVSECTADEDMDIHMLLGHTHEYGTLFEFELLADGEEPELLYHAIDGRLLRNTPEIKIYDPPLRLEEGDSFRMICAWDNPNDYALTWPEEMCVALMYYGPGRGWLTCGAEDEYPSALGGDPEAQGCADPSDEGNEKGVGRFCTVDSSECADNGEADSCLALFDAASNFCSFLGCTNDDECGEGAVCVDDEGPGSACVPEKCFDE